ncbi:MAG: phasin family protein [Rhodospirillales bacterium]|nr:MAG: phasin family protein [Rhodospirillales bacterium]
MAQMPEFPDLTKMMKDFDPTKFADEFSKVLKNYKLPGVDVDGLVASQRKNVEALTAANRVTFEGIQAIAKRQTEILQESMNEVSKAVDAITKAGSPPEAAAKQAELTKYTFEKALANMRELAEMVSKAQEEATKTINTRISETLDEVKEMALKMKQGAPAAPKK